MQYANSVPFDRMSFVITLCYRFKLTKFPPIIQPKSVVMIEFFGQSSPPHIWLIRITVPTKLSSTFQRRSIFDPLRYERRRFSEVNAELVRARLNGICSIIGSVFDKAIHWMKKNSAWIDVAVVIVGTMGQHLSWLPPEVDVLCVKPYLKPTLYVLGRRICPDTTIVGNVTLPWISTSNKQLPFNDLRRWTIWCA